jgi:hypothetical protein
MGGSSGRNGRVLILTCGKRGTLSSRCRVRPLQPEREGRWRIAK